MDVPACSCSSFERKLYTTGATDSSSVTWKSYLKSVPYDENQGNVQSFFALYFSILSIGARETYTNVVSRACRCARRPGDISSAPAVQLGHPSSQLGSNMK